MERKAQVWIETVLYTLIGLALIGMVLAFIMPRINETKDRLAIEQTISSLNDLGTKADLTPGNVRYVDFTMQRGEMTINSSYDQINFAFNDITKPYSEVGTTIKNGAIDILTLKGQKDYTVILTLNLAGKVNVTYDDKDIPYKLSASPTPYRMMISSEAAPDSALRIMNIKIAS